ncbi:MlaD family protein [Comamonas flocculans]|uniref:MCE family protein n=1 Tax=Comamonas flocculans TaxID=2597701 RepID=A0A5B8RS56_9BURK|nr:MlaD family protein [Comamonas flocculans]QEA11913.1 MCE family protein [Comamonas flocculans]
MVDPLTEPAYPPEEPLRPVAHLRLKALGLLFFTALLILGSVLYLLYARGAFEATQRLVLVTDDSEGVSVGMDMTFSGFPIGRVRNIDLASDGSVHIAVDVARKEAHWLRESSVFTLVRGLVGGTTIKAYSGVLSDPPLGDGAERPVIRGDVGAEVPQILNSARQLLDNLNQMTEQGSELAATLAQVRLLVQKFNGPGGALAALLGDDARSSQINALLQQASELLRRSNALMARLDTMGAKADRQLFGAGRDAGLMSEVRAGATELGALLQDARQSLKRVDAVLADAQAVGRNARAASTDLSALRADVDASLRKVQDLIDEVNRKWPFARDTELKLP